MGSLVESPVQLDKVMPHTRIRLCPDLAHVKKGGGDPLKVVKKYLDVYKRQIVDEVDSILVDEARTPLIISGQGDKGTDLYQQADRFVRKLKEEDDYEVKAPSHFFIFETVA